MQSKKRILIFSLVYYPRFVGGAEAAIKEITDRIDLAAFQFDMITLRFDKNLPLVEKIGNVRVYRIIGFDRKDASLDDMGRFPLYLNKILFPFLAAIGAWRLHRRNRYDAWWAMMTYMVLPIVLLRMVGVKLPYALTLQDGDPFEHVFNRAIVAPFRPLLRSGFKHASVVQAISHFLAGWVRTVGSAAPVEVIPNGADLAAFAKDYGEEEIEGVKRDIGKQPGDVFLVTTSRLVAKNALDDVIRALPLLPPAVKFFIIGIGPDAKKLKDLARDLGVASRVLFHGFVDNADIPQYLKACDIFVRPSRSEGMGSSFIEAMAAGIPVIATQEGGIADFLFDEEKNPDKPATGFAVEKDSPDQIAAAVRKILDNPEQTRRVVEQAQLLVKEKYDWALIARALQERVFEPVTAKRSSEL